MKESHSQKASGGFNAAIGTSSPGYSRSSKMHCGNPNQHGNPDALINKGRGPTGGGTSVPNRGKETFTGKPQQRQAVGDGATRAWDPKAGQNYKGNADSINVGRGPTKGNQR
jgi:hypothetical protein